LNSEGKGSSKGTSGESRKVEGCCLYFYLIWRVNTKEFEDYGIVIYINFWLRSVEFILSTVIVHYLQGMKGSSRAFFFTGNGYYRYSILANLIYSINHIS